MTELHGSHAASCLASQAGAQATNPMEGMVITTSRLGLWPEGPRTDRYGHAEYEFSYRVHRRNVTRRNRGPNRMRGPARAGWGAGQLRKVHLVVLPQGNCFCGLWPSFRAFVGQYVDLWVASRLTKSGIEYVILAWSSFFPLSRAESWF